MLHTFHMSTRNLTENSFLKETRVHLRLAAEQTMLGGNTPVVSASKSALP